MRCIGFVLVLGSVCLATSTAYMLEYAAIDKLGVAAKSQASQNAAVDALERLAEGKPEAVPTDFANQMGVVPTPGGWVTYRQISVRARAIQKLGEIGTDDVMSYLASLKEEEFAPNVGDRTQLGLEVQIALRSSQLARIPDEHEKVYFLEQLAVDPAFAPREWAVKQLCDMGSLISYPVVQQAIRKMDAGDQPRAEDEISFCLQRIEIIRSNPDRTKALMSALSPDPNQRNTRLVSWAVNQLLAVGSPDALQSLAKFSKTIGGMPHASTRATLAPIKERIDEELRKSAPAH